jgi:hypothetical protein
MSRMLLAILILSSTAFPCICRGVNTPAKVLMADDAMVFRGVVVERKTLPSRPDMQGRNRYAITFRVDEYWKGSPGRRVVIYGLDPGPDCLGDGGYQVGKAYLVFAREQGVKDVRLGDYLWYGWKDVLPEGSAILVADTACKPGGEVATVRSAIDQLGPGHVPLDRPQR